MIQYVCVKLLWLTHNSLGLQAADAILSEKALIHWTRLTSYTLLKVTGISVNKNLLLNNVLGLALDWFSEILIVKFIGVFQESIFNLLFNSKISN